MTSSNFEKYLEAAGRQAEIAAYNVGQLRGLLKDFRAGEKHFPPIPVQAHFEGTVIAAMAVVDKVAQATNSALHLGLRQGQLVEKSFKKLSERIPEVKSWYEQPIGRDLRKIRVRIIHYSYSKSVEGLRWVVESANTDYSGSRDLLEYAEAAATYVKTLVALLDAIKEQLAHPQ